MHDIGCERTAPIKFLFRQSAPSPDEGLPLAIGLEDRDQLHTAYVPPSVACVKQVVARGRKLLQRQKTRDCCGSK